MSDYTFYFTEEEKRSIQETWGSRSIACYEELEACRKLIVDLIIENQGLRLNQDLSIEFANWLCTHQEGFHPMYRDKHNPNIYWGSSYTGGRVDYTSKELFELFLKERKV